MFARRRPLLRAAAVGAGAYAMGKKSARREAEESAAQAGQDERIDSVERGQDGRGHGQPVAASAEPSMSDQLTQLSRLHREGALSDEEFAAAKSRLLGG
jgi:uncharacterized protein HemX